MNETPNEVTVFLIEDDDIDAMSVERSFRKLQIENPIQRAVDGHEALEMLAAGKISAPYIILLDLQMPRMGGLEFLREIRNSPAYKNSVIFVLSTSCEDKDLLTCYEQNIAGYFLKGQRDRELLDIITLLKGYWSIAKLPRPEVKSGQ